MFDAQLVLDAGFLPALFVAALAGFLSFLSPCVLPIVPPYLAYMGGVSVADMHGGQGKARGKVFLAAVFFVLGLSTVFLLMGISASALGRALGPYQGVLNQIAAVVIMLFGAHFIGIYRFGFMDREARIEASASGGSAMGAYVLGLAFAFGWTPCLGPILGAILGVAASGSDVSRGVGLLAAYALGLGVPFLLVAAFFPRLEGAMRWMRRHMGRIEKISGLMLWTVGLMMLTGQFTDFSFWLLETFPFLATIG
ncbi:cytochrome c biogenesis protein CcdA [Rhodobacteraceae bacterium]|nr:cytochrome c biogenesis protein CcdA [Paracoccaceae bacterium]